MRFRLGAAATLSALVLSVTAPAGAALAQAAPPETPATAPAATDKAADPVVARVGDQTIHLSDLRSAAATLPANLRSMPEQVLYPMLLDRLIDQEALAAEAQRTGLDKDPEVQRQVRVAERAALQRALLLKDVQPLITDEAVHARYEKDIAGKPGPEEVHAKHILVDSEAQAKDIIAQLKAGADFDTLAKKYSKDTGAGQGGDLGFFKKDDMVPEFAAVAFDLQPGQFTQTPVHTQFGWHVIKVLERRQDKPPTFDAAKDELRQRMAQEAAEKVVAEARTGVTIQKFNLDGSPIKSADAPAAAPATAPAAPAK
jgi:peptidyl-prolyl cis-trans isomerase C